MKPDGIFLSNADLAAIEHAATVLHAPFGYGSLDDWRSEVNRSLCRILAADLAIFFLAPRLEEAGTESEPIYSTELSPDQRADFIRYALHDAGSDRAMAFGLMATSQRAVVGDHWDGYYADDAVNAFYLPNHILDSVGMLIWDRHGAKEASIEIHREEFGTGLFGEEGVARLRLLLPSFKAAIAAVKSMTSISDGLETVLGRLGQPLAAANGHGRIHFQTEALRDLLQADPESGRLRQAMESLAVSHASLFEARGGGRRHRTSGPVLEAALTATSTVQTLTGQYLLSTVEAPAVLTNGNPGFLIRVEPMFFPVLSLTQIRSRFGLTIREVQVARLLGAGITNVGIASALAISPHTARRHTERVLAKLRVTSRGAVGAALHGEDGSPPPP
jgi:DNA-binding CsgD family transcriptional regulator